MANEKDTKSKNDQKGDGIHTKDMETIFHAMIKKDDIRSKYMWMEKIL